MRDAAGPANTLGSGNVLFSTEDETKKGGTMKRSRFLILLVAISCIAAVGCGGGGGSAARGGGSSASSGSSTFTFQGSVTGTIVVAEDTHGNSYTQDAGASKTFSLQLPAGTYRFYFIEKGVVAPLFDSGTNAFAIDGNVVINTGLVSLNTATGLASAAASLSAITGVSRQATNNTQPTFLTNPPTAGLSVQNKLDLAMSAIKSGGYLLARSYLTSAVNDGTATASQRDQAHFFLALVGVGSVGFELQTEGLTDKSKVSSFLDLAGFDTTHRGSIKRLVVPTTFLVTTPTGEDGGAFLRGRAVQELTTAIAHLSAVSNTFLISWRPPNSKADVKSDSGDALFFKAAFTQARGHLNFVTSYHLGGSVILNSHLKTMQQIVAGSNILTVANTALLGSVKTDYSNSVDLAVAAVNFMQGRSGSQSSFFVNTSGVKPALLTKWLNNAGTYKSALTQSMTVGPAGSTATLNLPPLFTNPGYDLSPYLPTFTGNVAGPRPTAFGSVYH